MHSAAEMHSGDSEPAGVWIAETEASATRFEPRLSLGEHPGRKGAEPPRPGARTRLWTIPALLAVLGLLGIGLGIGALLFDGQSSSDPPPVASTELFTDPLVAPNLTPVVTSVGPVQLDAQSQPDSALLGDTDPVVEVFNILGPSVVSILVPDGLGSGVVWGDSGLIITAAHVVTRPDDTDEGTLQDAESLQVRFDNGLRVEAEVVGTDQLFDVGVLRLLDPPADLVPAMFADPSTLQVGQLAVAIGSPFGLEQTVTEGVISALFRVQEGNEVRAIREMIQTDAAINLGNSGGVLADRQGRVIGMTTLLQTDGTPGSIGLGFALPSDVVLASAERIIAGEETRTGFLGITGGDAESGVPGAFVISVTEGLPAEQAGLQEGDIIVGFNGEQVSSMLSLQAKVVSLSPGSVVTVDVLRDGVVIPLTVTLTSLP